MKNKFNIILIAIAIIAGVTIAAKGVSANVSYFIPYVTTSSATSTPVTVSPGSATSVLTYDSLAKGSSYSTDKASLLIQQTASTSLSIIKIAIQYSQDGIDWYDNNLNATTTTGSAITDITTANTYQLGGNTTASTSMKAINVQTPTRYIRAVFSAVTATSTVWGQFVPIRQVQN